MNCCRFPSLSFLACHILAIPRSRIETEHIFSVASVLTSLCHCHLGLSNMDSLLMIYKNWPDNTRAHCKSAPNNVQEFFEPEFRLLDDYEDNLEDTAYFDEQV